MFSGSTIYNIQLGHREVMKTLAKHIACDRNQAVCAGFFVTKMHIACDRNQAVCAGFFCYQNVVIGHTFKESMVKILHVARGVT